MRRAGVCFSVLGLVSVLTVCSQAEQARDEVRAEAGISHEAEHNMLTSEEVAAGWSLLFYGFSTKGWRGYLTTAFPPEGWAIADGNLVVFASDGSEGGRGGDIVTEQQFSDFELVFDFKLSPVGNSGVFYRVKEVDGTTMWEVAPEFQVLDDTAYIDMGTMDMNKHLTGDNYDLHSSMVTATSPVGEWNTGRIVVLGNHVEHWLNGQLTVQYDYYTDEWKDLVRVSKFDPALYARSPSGSIGLQDHGHDVRYRNIKIRPHI